MVKNRRYKMEEINLLGKVVMTGKIKAETGLFMGGSTVGLDIGGVDSAVIKDSEGKPYIPGSSLKGKMRSLSEKYEGLATDENRVWIVKPDEKGEKGVSIHLCDKTECKICNIFGRTNGDFSKIDNSRINRISEEKVTIKSTTPTRLIVRDCHFIEESLIPEDIRKDLHGPEEIKKALEDVKKRLDLEWTQVKFENVIDRITSQATPRQIERVPAGAEFNFEMIYNVFNEQDKDNLKQVFKAMELLENDYLGGQGTRGYGKVKFDELKVYWNSKGDYEKGEVDIMKKESINKEYATPAEIVKNFPKIKSEIKE
jgi:CRISPR-associated protein Csm3